MSLTVNFCIKKASQTNVTLQFTTREQYGKLSPIALDFPVNVDIDITPMSRPCLLYDLSGGRSRTRYQCTDIENNFCMVLKSVHLITYTVIVLLSNFKIRTFICLYLVKYSNQKN